MVECVRAVVGDDAVEFVDVNGARCHTVDVDVMGGQLERELDKKGLKWYEENAHDAWRAYSKAIVATPGQVSVSINGGEC